MHHLVLWVTEKEENHLQRIGKSKTDSQLCRNSCANSGMIVRRVYNVFWGTQDNSPILEQYTS